MSAKWKNLLFALAYVVALVAAVVAKFIYVENGVGFDISLALLFITTIAVAVIVFATNILVDDPHEPSDSGGPPAKLSEEKKYEDRKSRAYWLLMHILVFTAVAVLPFETSPRISLFILLTLLVIELASIAAKNYKDYQKRQTENMEKLVANGEAILPYLVAALLVMAAWQKFDGSGFCSALYEKTKTYVAELENTRAREQAKGAPKWGQIFGTGSSAGTSSACDPLAADQRVVLHQGLPQNMPATPTVHPDFTASVNNWHRPVDFTMGRTDGIALSPDSFINITTPEDACYIVFLANASGAGMDLVFENGKCEKSGAQYTCTGSWHQGSARGTYKMNVHERGATARLWAIVDGDSCEVGQITILTR